MTTVLVVLGKMTVKIGDGGDAGIKSMKKGIQFYLEYPLSLKSEIVSYVYYNKMPKYALSLDASKVKKKLVCLFCATE